MTTLSQVPSAETTPIEPGPEVRHSDPGQVAGNSNNAPSDNGLAVRLAAGEMIATGLSPIPVPFRDKKPALRKWQTLRLTPDTINVYFSGGPSNIGLLLGDPSNDHVDVDLDAIEAVAAAKFFLPSTGRVHGRPGKPRSHWWYRASPAPKTAQFEDPGGAMLVELRSTGAQTIVPPSVHPSGETLAWHSTGMPTVVEPAELESAVAALAACAMLARRWTLHTRHKTSMALAGMLLRADWSEERTVAFIRAVATVAMDEEVEQRVSDVATTAQRLAAGENVIAGTTLAELLPEGKQVVIKLRKWLALGSQVAKPDPTTTAAPAAPSTAGMIAIDLDGEDLAAETAAAWKAIYSANNPVQFFRHGGVPVRIERDELRVPVIRPLTVDRLRHHLARIAQFTKKDKRVRPPADVVRDILATPNMPLPILSAIVQTPVFGSDGSIHDQPGYNPTTEAYYMPPRGFTMPSVPDNPTVDEVTRARSLLLDELFVDFPFVSDAERAHAVGLLILPFMRRFITGPTPLHLIEKPSPGTGSSLLAGIITEIATGRIAPVMTEARNEEEWRKRITAKLMDGPAVVIIDNLRSRLDSGALSAVITTATWEDRLLGVSQTVRMPVLCAWIATANNPSLSQEMGRRTIRIRMDAKVERPWLRAESRFRHPDLRSWARAHRGELVWAILVLGRAWVAAGRPVGPRSLGMFESWAEVIGGILQHAGIVGFLDNVEEFYDVADPETIAYRAFIETWWRQFNLSAVTAAELLPHADTLDLGVGGDASRKTRLGVILRGLRDRRFDIFRVTVCGTRHHANDWKLDPDPCPACGQKQCWSPDQAGGWHCSNCSIQKAAR